ncbi:hypothetical protein H2201_003802 [Coniosporium apollinis]|uniref:Peptidase S9 prolyl oligopeptidase catalytic domain-containing protein n=1 Tax=Coniosporium apollinis TaxID=61459 RepID=A0ABQ9NXV0_9PEZI|nr:hypothetical protein H2201_003802 [Coniosporium apollinis]
MERNDWQGPGVDTDSWLVSGHSNGGQGTWYALTHHPDKIIAAAPVSGYLSIQSYVPYQLWQPIDPRRRLVLDASMNSYRHELLAENAKGIPILQQHGSDDDNVPAYHSRLMSQLLSLTGWHSTYAELAGEGHWFDGVMTTEPLRNFYNKHLKMPTRVPQRQCPRSGNAGEFSASFSLVVANPADTGPKRGVQVTHLEDPGQLGRVDVLTDCASHSMTVKTSNVVGFLIRPYDHQLLLSVDNQKIRLPNMLLDTNYLGLWKDHNGLWRITTAAEPKSLLAIRKGRQLGGLEAILRSTGRFTIRYHDNTTYRTALQIARNLYQYFSADSSIEHMDVKPNNQIGNVISVTTGMRLPRSVLHSFPVEVTADRVLSIRDSDGRQRLYAEDSLSAIFLRPLGDEGLEMVIWGADVDSVAIAARLVPMLTGVGQPDFVVLGDSSRWDGVNGALAMGFFDHAWNVSKSSFFA